MTGKDLRAPEGGSLLAGPRQRTAVFGVISEV
jgi:hypothetical protein